MSNRKRLLVYIIPVTVLSFALNIPKFMEVTMINQNNTTGANDTNGTNDINGTNETVSEAKLEIGPTEMRRDTTYIFWYKKNAATADVQRAQG